jgi:hypothetical protein
MPAKLGILTGRSMSRARSRCPPRPEALLDGIIALQRRVSGEEIADKWAG